MKSCRNRAPRHSDRQHLDIQLGLLAVEAAESENLTTCGVHHPSLVGWAGFLLGQPGQEAVEAWRHQFQHRDGRAGALDALDLEDLVGDAVEVAGAAGHHLGHEVRVAGGGVDLNDLRDRGEAVLPLRCPGLADGVPVHSVERHSTGRSVTVPTARDLARPPVGASCGCKCFGGWNQPAFQPKRKFG